MRSCQCCFHGFFTVLHPVMLYCLYQPTHPTILHPFLVLQPLKASAAGGSANHTHNVLFCPVERRFPYIRIQTRQVGGHGRIFTAGQASKKREKEPRTAG